MMPRKRNLYEYKISTRYAYTKDQDFCPWIMARRRWLKTHRIKYAFSVEEIDPATRLWEITFSFVNVQDAVMFRLKF